VWEKVFSGAAFFCDSKNLQDKGSLAMPLVKDMRPVEFRDWVVKACEQYGTCTTKTKFIKKIIPRNTFGIINGFCNRNKLTYKRNIFGYTTFKKEVVK
jgi:hypothetical protein